MPVSRLSFNDVKPNRVRQDRICVNRADHEFFTVSPAPLTDGETAQAGRSSPVPFRLRILAVFCGLAVLAAPLEAQGARPCAPRDSVVEALSQKHGETLQSIGLDRNRSMMEVFVNRETGSWTIVVTTADGITCLLSSGIAFDTLAVTAQPEGDAL